MTENKEDDMGGFEGRTTKGEMMKLYNNLKTKEINIKKKPVERIRHLLNIGDFQFMIKISVSDS